MENPTPIQISVAELTRTEFALRLPEVFAETWTKHNRFSLYRHLPRPTSALFFICADLTVTFYEEGKSPLSAREGDIVYIPEGTRYHVCVNGSPSGGISTYTVNFRLLDRSGSPILLSPDIRISAHAEDSGIELRITALDKAIRQNGGTEEPPNLLRINAEFYALLDTVVSAALKENDLYYPIRVGAEALRAEWNKNERIEKYAALCGVSSAYFYRCFREWAGKSPVEYRNLLRLSHAETMLRYTDMRISEISQLIGFEDPFYFCRLFSRQYGSSPLHYRKTFRSET